MKKGLNFTRTNKKSLKLEKRHNLNPIHERSLIITGNLFKRAQMEGCWRKKATMSLYQKRNRPQSQQKTWNKVKLYVLQKKRPSKMKLLRPGYESIWSKRLCLESKSKSKSLITRLDKKSPDCFKTFSSRRPESKWNSCRPSLTTTQPRSPWSPFPCDSFQSC